MTEPELDEAANAQENAPADPDAIQPSWKPLFWLIGVILGLILLGEFLLEFILEAVETLWLILIEAPEEFLEDLLAEWLKNHFPRDAHRYSEITTAIGLTPLKIVLVLVAARWGWKYSRAHVWPRVRKWFHLRYSEVKYAWLELNWFYRTLVGLAALAFLSLLAMLI